MADNFSDKVVKKLQKQNLAVDLTEEIVIEAVPEAVPESVPEEVVIQSQDVQSMGANDVTAFTPGSAGLTQPEAVFKDIIITPGPRNAGQTHNTASQINFYDSTSAVAFDTTGYDQQIRTTIFNYIEGAEAPALVIGGYNGTLNLAPTTAWGGAIPGTSGVTAAKIWIHPFTGKVDASIFDGNKLVLSQTTNTPQISFGSTATTQTSLATAGDLAWDGTTFKVHNGTSVQTLAYSSQVPGAQDIFKNMTDGTNIAAADGQNDTFTFTAGTGITCAVNASTDTLTISTANIPNGSLTNSAVTIGNTSVTLGTTVTAFTGLSSVTSSAFVGPLTGNASTATSAATLTTARNIQGVSFNGSADITVVTAGTGVTVTGTSVAIGQAVGTSSAVTFGSVTANGARIGNAAGTVDTSSGTLSITAANNIVNITATTVTLAPVGASSLSANSNRIQSVSDPTSAQDAATKAYVDALKVGIDVHESVRCVIVAQIAGNYVQANAAGSSSSGAATITFTATGTTTIDTNVTLAAEDRVLVTGGISGSITASGSVITNTGSDPNKFAANGIYRVSTAGSAGVATVLTRALDTDDNVELEGGTFTFVQEGATYADSGWVCTTNTSVTPITFAPSTGTTGNITFTQFTGAGQIVAGNGLDKTNNTIFVGGTTDRISVLADSIDISSNYVGQTSITTLGTIGTGTWNATTISVAKGGTGLTAFTDKGVFYANGTGAVGQVTGTSGQLLVASATAVPTFVGLSGDATLAAAGGLTLATVNSNVGTFGTATVIPSVSVNAKGLVTGVTTNSIPTATSSVLGLASFGTGFSVTSGAVSLSTVTVGLGGTGATSFTTNAVLYGNAANAIQATAAGTTGQLLVASATGVPTFVSMSGDATIVAGGALTLATSGVSAATYGSATQVAQVAVDAKGRVTTASNVAINISSAVGSQSANTFFAAPNGSAAAPSFRAIVLADIPTITIAKGGTNATGQTSNGITYFDGTSITSGLALTWIPGNAAGTGSGSALYVNAASLAAGTAMTVNAVAGATGKLISGSLGGTEKFSVDVNGNLRATTKSFDIPHPTKEGKRLVYGVLEGPEHGVYHRGTVEGKDKIKVELPEYWYKLVGENYSVQLTSWGPYAVHLVEKTENYFVIQLSSNLIMRKLKTIKVDYVVHGARLDAPLEIEQ